MEQEKKIFKLMGFSMENSNNIPKVTEKKGKKYIAFGENNTYPDFLIDNPEITVGPKEIAEKMIDYAVS